MQKPKITEDLANNLLRSHAELLAADLAGAEVDPNEAQKALAYLRSKRNERNGRALFDYLAAVTNNGQVVIRSGRTLGYYRDLQRICLRHLAPLQDDYDAMLWVFGWSLRLLRYYRTVPRAAKELTAQRRQEAEAPRPATAPTREPPRPTTPQLPAVGSTFIGSVIAVDETAALVAVPGFDEEQVVGVLKAETLEGKVFRAGNSARVEVVAVRQLKSGRTVLELKPAQRTR